MSSAGGELLRVSLPLPPSLNHAYVNIARGRKKSAAAVFFEIAARGLIGDAMALRPLASLANEPLVLRVEIEIDAIENKGWSSGKSKTRYKRLDVSNRIKLVEDVLCSMLGIDDSQFMSVTAVKRQGERDGCIITLSRMEGS